jgi:hypothetical protein
MEGKESEIHPVASRWKKIKYFDPYLGEEVTRYWGPYKPSIKNKKLKQKEKEND